MLWTYLGMGLTAGTIVSSWQGYKDPPWEGFIAAKFARSIVVGAGVSFAFYVLLQRGVPAVDNLGLLLLTILATERLVGETYKGFLRSGPHPEYFKLFHRLGLPTGSHVGKFVFGLVFLAGGLWLYWLFGRLGVRIAGTFGMTPLAGLLIGAAAGAMVAAGGALKDSQFEGFKAKKFVRSPIVAAIGSMWLITLSDDPALVAVGAIGFERVGVEFYKTFLTRQVRGFHAGKPVTHPEWLERRWVFLVSFVAAVAVCGALLVA